MKKNSGLNGFTNCKKKWELWRFVSAMHLHAHRLKYTGVANVQGHWSECSEFSEWSVYVFPYSPHAVHPALVFYWSTHWGRDQHLKEIAQQRSDHTLATEVCIRKFRRRVQGQKLTRSRRHIRMSCQEVAAQSTTTTQTVTEISETACLWKRACWYATCCVPPYAQECVKTGGDRAWCLSEQPVRLHSERLHKL